MTEGYAEFLRRVHEQDVAKGQALHRPGVCDVCDAAESQTFEREEVDGNQD